MDQPQEEKAFGEQIIFVPVSLCLWSVEMKPSCSSSHIISYEWCLHAVMTPTYKDIFQGDGLRGTDHSSTKCSDWRTITHHRWVGFLRCTCVWSLLFLTWVWTWLILSTVICYIHKRVFTLMQPGHFLFPYFLKCFYLFFSWVLLDAMSLQF